MDLTKTAHGLMRLFRTTDGRSFYGQFTKPAMSALAMSTDPPQRYIRTTITAPVGIRDVMLTTDGRFYLLASYDDNDTMLLQAKAFRLFEVNQTISWARPVSVADAVTGLNKSNGTTSMGTLRCSLDHPTVIESGVARVVQQNWRVVTAEMLQLGDIVMDTFRITQVTERLGVTFAEAQ